MHGDYCNYNVNDFVWDEDFRNWVLSPSKISEQFWQEWIKLHPESMADIEAAREIIFSLNIAEKKLGAEERADFLDQAMFKITGKKGHTLTTIKRLLVAASFISLLVVTYFYFLRPVHHQHSQTASKSLFYKNHKDSDTSIKLSDGTEVVLDAKSSLRIDSFFNRSSRKVYLSGNAFFHVSRDTSKPFYVYCRRMEAKVLGTSFRITSDSLSDKVQLIVRSGIVSVSMPENVKGRDVGVKTVVVTRNQQAECSIQNSTLSKSIIANPVESDENFINFVYDGKPVYDIFRDIEKAYDISVLFDKAAVPNHEFSGNLQGKTMQEKIEVICQALGFSYKIDDAKIFVR